MKRILVAFFMLINIASKMDASEEMKKMAQLAENYKMLTDEAEMIKAEIRHLDNQRDLNTSLHKLEANKENLEKINEKISALKYRLEIITHQLDIAKLNEKLEAMRIDLLHLKPTDKKQRNSIEANIKKIKDEIKSIEDEIKELEKSENYDENMEIQAKKIRYDVIKLERERKQLAKSNTEENKKKIKEIESDINAREGMIAARKLPQHLKNEKRESFLKGENIRGKKIE